MMDILGRGSVIPGCVGELGWVWDWRFFRRRRATWAKAPGPRALGPDKGPGSQGPGTRVQSRAWMGLDGPRVRVPGPMGLGLGPGPALGSYCTLCENIYPL